MNPMHQLLPAILGLAVMMSAASAQSPIEPGAKVRQLAGGFRFTEGPTADAAGNVYFTDQPNNRILRWSIEGELSTFLEPAGRSNGLYFDAEGQLWACADEKNELWKIDPVSKKITVVVREFQGKRLNGPNDVWVSPAGRVYFTDPFYKRPYWQRGPEEQEKRGLYLLDRDQLLLLDGDFVQPNGIVGRGDGKVLYVSDLGKGRTYAYEIQEDGRLKNRRLLIAMGSDGMTIDQAGNLYLTGKGVTVVSPEGKVLERIEVPEPWTANVCFGGADRKTLFITASQGLYAIATKIAGAGPTGKP
jgi:gluconolactonase